MRSPSPQTNERNVIVVTGCGHFGTHFFELMYPTLAVSLARDSGIPLEQVLGWSFFGYLFFGLGALPAGLLTDWLGARVMLIACMGGMGVSALAAGEVPGGLPLTLCLAALGLFASIYHPAGMSLISHAISARGRALGVNGIFGSLAIATTPFVTAQLSERIGWQDTYRLTGFIMCGIAILCALLPVHERLPATTPTETRASGRGAPRMGLLFLLLCAAAMLGGISYRGNTLVQPAYFAERVSLLHFGTATSLVYVFGIGGQYLGGVLADRYDLRWLYLAFHAVSLPALILMVGATGLPLLAAGSFFVFFSLGMQPIENSLFARFTPARWRATGYGIKFVLTFGVGSLAVAVVKWAERTGDLSWALMSFALVVGVLVAVIGAFVLLTPGQAILNRRVTVAALPDVPPAAT